ncbi:aldo/keto reductase [Clostridium saccharoperbutylacetonicum]|uniref:Putative oxidoreductase, aryl-alcohol dehydrogenase like protein n=1 Tax=Clostridium saccharoperbutylacetonicum N1-4(HMT) TaxID=931276 RepID=M1N5K7_9CLOT|nr:aldo/keto reductase [Clostridium saccharoperbutylacetonicum]AGF58692.1 putative oxidoreductase, aryl-alcohol dehydrogenase like protein [Clostridium saccharoperbutylacetonicum N1-4(HMT)]AQR97385.1 general stress protein 69 [Clostridium saccharoperbutylacetonicum]NRT60529.1 aryl-alcohol dehydrogenase-like predicted oxidoreductase [Clostridium saccharoperbutylacetonicum]NSB23843.1 aryl-alcohol dehydrogenase-like predicted oxidoreductase [Clostridium saccharoperbutylacetonicum]NSB33269.1 aryl-
MKKIQLGKSSINASVIGLGAINFGTAISEDTAFKLMDHYVLNGGNLIDTANNYAVWNGGDGSESEKTIGKWIKRNGKNKDLFIATKLGALPKEAGKRDFSDMQGLSSSVIIDSVNKSLDNLNVDYIDLLYLHVDDFNTPQEETLGALNELINKGLIKEIGCSNFRTWRIESARNICLKNNYKFFCAVQQRFSYLSPTIDSDFFPQVPANRELESYIDYHKDLTLMAYSPLLGGQYNTDKIKKDEYKTYFNEIKLKKLLNEQSDPNLYVLNYINTQFGGSVALVRTSKVDHLNNIMQSEFFK